MHISRLEDGSYDISQNDLEEIMDASWVKDRHWSENRARGAVEAVLGGVFREEYAEMSEWTVATEEEIESTFGLFFSKDIIRDSINEAGAEIISDAGREDSYSVSESVVEKLSSALKNMLAGTKYEVIDIEGDKDEYVANVRITPYSISTDEIQQEAEDRLAQEIDSISDITVFVDRVYELLAELIADHIEEGEYGDSSVYQIHLKFNKNNAYEIDLDEVYSLFNMYGISDYVEDPDTDAEEEKASSEDENDGEEKSSEKEDSEESTSSGSASSRESGQKEYTSGKDIPVSFAGNKIEFGKTKLQDLLDMTGFEIEEDSEGKKIGKDDLEFVNLNAGNDDYFITVHMENYTSDEERNAEDCNVYGIDVQSVAEDLGNAAELMSIGGIRIGDTKEDAISAFGTPAAGDETDDYVAYSFDDYMYSIQFMYNEDGIIDAMYLSYLYF